MHHACPIGGEPGEGAGDPGRGLLLVRPDELFPDPGRVGDRPEKIEYRPYPQLRPRLRRVFHRGMEEWGKEEPDADDVEAGPGPLGGNRDVDAERRKEIGAPAPARHRAVPVFGHHHARACGHKRGECRDVECAQPVSPRPAHVDRMGVVGSHLHRFFTHRAGKAHELVHGLPLCAQRHQKARDLRIRRLAGHDEFERRRCLIGRKVLAGKAFFDTLSHRHDLTSIQLRIINSPSSVSIDSG